MSRNVLAIIGARAGSKGVPGKNTIDVAGAPLIAWSIRACQGASCIARTIVSTDSEEIAGVSRTHGAEVPFLRPEELARDETPAAPFVLHALAWLKDHDAYVPEYFVLIQPTSPLRTSEDIDGALGVANEKSADAVVSVTPVTRHPFWTKGISDDGRLVDFFPDVVKERRQLLPPAYALNGAIYLARTEVFLREKTWYTPRTFAWVMPNERSLDVDTPWDLELVRLVLEARRKREG